MKVINVKKKIIILLAAFTLLMTSPAKVKITDNSGDISVKIVKAEVQAAAVTITVNKADAVTVKKIHKKLAAGKAINLKVKGNASASKKLLNQVIEKIKMENKQGVIFEYKKGKSSGGYTKYVIDSDKAGTYKYAVKFIDKLYGLLRKDICNNESYMYYFEDLMTYPDENERKLRWAYDFIVKNKYKNRVMLAENEPVTFAEDSYNQPVTKCESFIKYDNFYNSYELNRSLIKSVNYNYTIVAYKYSYNEGYDILDEDREILKKSEYNFETKPTKEDLTALKEAFYNEVKNNKYGNCLIKDYYNATAKGYTFDEFCKLPIAQTMADSVRFHVDLNSGLVIIYNCKNFCDLSDAMKVFAIAQSGYFRCNYERPQYGMMYNDSTYDYTEKTGMKTLYKNKAVGVCEEYARYECQVWRALGMKCFYKQYIPIYHAWSVVVAENSDGKKLWIPFDYGIGPTKRLALKEDIWEKYLKTESMRYKLYLKGIKGAPKEKNFEQSDFK